MCEEDLEKKKKKKSEANWTGKFKLGIISGTRWSHILTYFRHSGQFPQSYSWIYNCIEQRHGLVFRFKSAHSRNVSLALKRETAQYNPAELNQPRQNRAVLTHRDT